MINSRHKHLYWTSNKEEVMGFAPGTVFVADYQSGGGFAGAPEVFIIGLVEGIAPNQPKPEPAEWLSPGNSVEYRIGGHLFSGYHYHDPRRVG